MIDMTFCSSANFQMKITFRIASLAAGLSLGLATGLSAQNTATFGSAEAAGFGEGSALIGTSINGGVRGWGPVATLVGQTYRYRSGINSHAQAWAISPSLGLVHTTAVGAVQGSVGYTFVRTEGLVGTVNPDGILGVEGGSRSGVFVSGQGNYWGDGENTAQAIASYGFASEYLWSRVRAAHRLAPSATPFYLGGEFVYQGTQKAVPSRWRYQVGPTIEYRFTPEFRMGASAGYRGGNNNAPGSGYGRVEFLILTKR